MSQHAATSELERTANPAQPFRDVREHSPERSDDKVEVVRPDLSLRKGEAIQISVLIDAIMPNLTFTQPMDETPNGSEKP